MFKRTTVTMTLAAIATVAVNLQSPVFAAAPSLDPVITETPGLPGIDSLSTEAPTLEDALADYLAGLGPEEDDFGGPAEVATLPDDVIDAIGGTILDLPGLTELPPLTIEDTEPPIDEPVCGEPGAICEGPDEGAELPLDPTDTCEDEGVACEFDPTVEGESYPWDVPVDDDSEIPFDDHGWVEPDHDESSYSTDAPAVASENVTSTTAFVSVEAASSTVSDSVDAAVTETSEAVTDVASAFTVSTEEDAAVGFDAVTAALVGLLATLAVAALGFGAYRMGRRGA